MQLEPDIVARIKSEFSACDAEIAIQSLKTAGKSGRIARCIIVCAQGSLKKLADCIRLADQDYRDLIIGAEYHEEQRVRDLTASFLIDSPQKMWISQVAAILQNRGYYLRSLKTASANAGGSYLSDLGEGVATFDGDPGPLTVVKTRGQWTVNGDNAELQLYSLSTPFTDEGKFCDVLSSYILGRRSRRE